MLFASLLVFLASINTVILLDFSPHNCNMNHSYLENNKVSKSCNFDHVTVSVMGYVSV